MTLQRGHATRSFSLRPGVLYALAVAMPVLFVLATASTLAFAFRDNLVTALVAHQSDLAARYRDRVARLTHEIDATRAADRMDRDLLEHRLAELVARQKSIESRTATVAALAGQLHERVAGNERTVAARQDATRSSALTPLIRIGGAERPSLPKDASAFAASGISLGTAERDAAAASASKPVPESVEATPAEEAPQSGPLGLRSDLGTDAMPVSQKLERVALAMDATERAQSRSIDQLAEAARQRSTRMRAALDAIGLDPGRLKLPPHAKAGIGGPLVPLPADYGHSPLDHKIALLEHDLLGAGQVSRLAPYLPLGLPVSEALEVNSPFGPRVDPFTGREMLHPGVDLHEEFGDPIRATGGGRVAVAGPYGGYGNMVEIDHGNGLITRYGHLSAIEVHVGQWVQAGQTIGRAGSTGRSTGPHLHYEVRIDGVPVDPMPFIRAGQKIYAML